MHTPELLFADGDRSYIGAFRKALNGFIGVSAMVLDPQKLHTRGVVDAIYLPLPYAERWGALPLVHKAQVLPTRAGDPDDAMMCPYVIAGVATSADDPKDSPSFDLALIIRCTLLAVAEHNEACESELKIRRVGIWPPMVNMTRLPPEVAAGVVQSAYTSAVGFCGGSEETAS